MDTTYLREENQQLKSSIKELAFLNDLSRAIGASFDSEEIMQTIIRKSIREIDAEQGAIFLIDAESDKEMKTLVRTMTGHGSSKSFGLDQSLLGWIRLNEKPLNIVDPNNDERFPGLEWDQSIRSVACAPLMVRSNIIGILSLHNKKGEPAFSENDLRLLSIIASQSAQIVENVRLNEQEKDLRKSNETALQENLERMRKIFQQIVLALAATAEVRDPYTAGHQQRVSQLACAIAGELGMDEEKIEGLRVAGILHDIGKIYVPSDLLNKPGRISETEFDMIKTHSKVGYEILCNIEFPWPTAKMVIQHHERLDGNGYPANLSGEEIMIEARILSVADVVEAMSSHRPYRPALGLEKAIEEITRSKNTGFDPDVVDACLKLFKEKDFSFTE
jgi:putative nucleotidyltransferase with HDIG domain